MMAGGPRQQEQRKANVRLGIILASVAIIFALGFMARMWLIGGRAVADQKRRLLASTVHGDNLRMVGKLVVIAGLMFGFGYGLVPMYRHICAALGINVLSLSERQATSYNAGSSGRTSKANTQVDTTRTITIEFDANSRGPWEFKPAKRSVQVHPGELTTVMYDFKNVQNRVMAAQAIPSYAPKQATAYFNKLECFCFNEYTLQPGEVKAWPVTFVIDPKLPKDVTTITLSYTFFEVPGKQAADVVQAPAKEPRS